MLPPDAKQEVGELAVALVADDEEARLGMRQGVRGLKLKNKGNFKDPNSEQVPVSLAWDVNVDAPVVDKLGFGKK